MTPSLYYCPVCSAVYYSDRITHCCPEAGDAAKLLPVPTGALPKSPSALKPAAWLRLQGESDGYGDVASLEYFTGLLRDGYSKDEAARIAKIKGVAKTASVKRRYLELAEQYVVHLESKSNGATSEPK